MREEGEETLIELVRNARKKSLFPKIKSISYHHKEKIYHNPSRPLIDNLNELPYPGYHFVEDNIQRYRFAAMAGRKAPYALIEGSRGCSHRCTFCTQWRHWCGVWRLKSAERIADEMEYCYQKFGSRFIWLIDDDFGSGNRAKQLADELLKRKIGDDLMWFLQWRSDDVVRNSDVLPKMRRTGLHWVMIGVERSDDYTLKKFNKNLNQEDSKTAIKLLKKNDIFAHAMFVIGDRKDTTESISNLRDFSNELDPDFAIFTTLTPFPGIELFDKAKRNGWIEDYNWSHYDMIHAIMPTESLSRNEVQEEVYECYRNFYGSIRRRFEGIFSSNSLKRRIFMHMLRQGVIKQLRSMF